MADNSLQKVQSFQYPKAHLGHLNSSQIAALDKFRTLCQDQGYYTPAGPGGKPAASHDDETLLRYLRARKFIPKDAFGQFKDTEDWRKTNKLDQLYETIDVNHYEETRRLYPQWTGRRDKRGIPVYVFEVAPLDSKAMAIYDKSVSKSTEGTHDKQQVSTKLIRLFALYENLIRFTLPLCSAIPDRPFPETPVSQSNNIVDISRVGLKQFWNLKAHMQDASTLATAHYPETLDRIFIIGAPSFFPTVWGWIKRWFDPITVSKIFILSSGEMKKTLEQYINIEDIPKKYGGQLDWDWGDKPILEPAIQKVLDWKDGDEQKGAKTFPTGPIRWNVEADGTMTALAVGSTNGKSRDRTIATIPKLAPPSTLNIPREQAVDVTGPLSTTGIHTHPDENQSYFPSSGQTPPEETTEEALGAGIQLPSHTKASTSEDPALDETTPSRAGTSSSRFEQQNMTLAAGNLAEGTPDYMKDGSGDKYAPVETATVGQAPKDVKVPEAESDVVKDESYIGQAKAAASSVYATTTSVATAVSSTVASAVGLGSGEPAKEEKSEEADDSSAKVEDPRVDALDRKHVEDFVRSQHLNHSTQPTDVDSKAT